MAVNKPLFTEADIWANSADSTDIQKPSAGKISEGWRYGEKPPHEFFNWRWQTYDQFLNHIYQNGIPEWDDTTTYNAGALTLYNGQLWHAINQNQNSVPSTGSSDWALGSGSYDIAFTDLTDVDVASSNANDMVYYNGTQWVSDSISNIFQTASVSLNDLSDVSISGLADNHVLVYDASQGRWENRAGGTGGGGGLGALYKYEFTATDGQTVFNCSHNPSWVYVSVSGVDLPSTEYTADGSSITLNTPASENDIVIVMSATGVEDYTEYNFDATAGQTDFTVSNRVFSKFRVYKDGVRVRDNQYSISDNGTDTTVTFNTAMSGGEWILLDVPSGA